ncbi:AHH domain-containing protein [Novosphingobium sp. KACC 22771]|uniref:AHH domain-containing protein n=1 Tax=Novosphingobium sp. KACC 22771 TaxID=3025670 RepID=UPI0023662F5E|nr:AHH domain-containing protein [Novosphingobium sp. KACC 22771]WDF71222.1 AHH domain-containing protein [Novosphingobium sp. KACC 22771]
MPSTLTSIVATVPPVAGGGAIPAVWSAFAEFRHRARRALPFRAVNQSDSADYDPALQRHHILPKQLLSQRCFGPMFDTIGRDQVGFDDFRSNGLLLPARDSAAIKMSLPMHRGPHRDYNALVMERVGQVEARWSGIRRKAPEVAMVEAVQRLTLLQKALRRRLLRPQTRPMMLNRYDPMQRHLDFTELDAMVDMLWPETQLLADLGL